MNKEQVLAMLAGVGEFPETRVLATRDCTIALSVSISALLRVPGEFAAVKRRFRLLRSTPSPSDCMTAFEEDVALKRDGSGAVVGFR